MFRVRIRLAIVLSVLAAMLPALAAPAGAVTGDLVITGVVDGPLSGGIPKAVELYVVNPIPDLSIYGVGGANNGGGSDGEEFTFPAASAGAGDFIYVASESTGFNSFFGFAPDYTSSTALSINGDDAIELFMNGAVVDVFGDIDTDGTGQPWEYLDGWAYRIDGTGADGTSFMLGNWTFSGPNALDGETGNAGAASPFPIGTYTTTMSGPSIVINEVDADTPGSDAAEFVELYDGGAGNTDLSGLTVVFYNGSDDASYQAFDLDGLSTDGGGYFVMGNAAVANVDLVFAGNGLQNGADAVALVEGDAVDFPNDTPVSGTDVVDALVYDTSDSDDAVLIAALTPGQAQVNENGKGNKDNQSNQRCPDGSGGARMTGSYEQWSPSPGEENLCKADPIAVFIHDIQGPGSSSPLAGTDVVIEGVVVGDFQDGLNGFFLQEEDSDADGDPATSEGLFVFQGGLDVDVVLGDVVQVTGTAAEFFGMTQVSGVSEILVTDTGASVTPADIAFPFAASSDFEVVEGMAINLTQEMVITEYFNFDRFGDVVIAPERLPQPTAVYEPGSPEAAALADVNARSRITVDDGRTSQNPDPALHPNGMVFDLTNRFRGGDTLTGNIGVMHYSFGQFRIQATGQGTYVPANPRPPSPADVGGDITVASFNVLNYFSTIDDSGPICGPNEDQGCRGADDAEEFTRQRDKIIAAINDIDADVVGLIEIENHPTDAALIDLVDGLNAAAGSGTWDYVPAGPTGPDVIKVAFIYQPATISLLGPAAILDTDEFLDPNDTGDDRNRAALAQTFVENVTGEAATVVVNHFKSKGSPCGPGDDDPETGSCNLTRTLAAGLLADWLDGDPTASGDSDVLIIGDLNSYDKEDPIDVLKGAGYNDLVFDFLGEDAYSFVFSGQWGYLDYAMASPSLQKRVTGVDVWHINADEPDILDYDTRFKKDAQDALYEPNAYRSSDHDPVIVGLNLADPMGDKEDVVDDLDELLPGSGRLTERRLTKAIGAIEASLIADRWTSDQTIVAKKVFDKERAAVAQLELIVAGGGSEADAAMDAIGVLVNADRQLAQIELLAAIVRGGDAGKIAEAMAAMADAADLTAAGLFNEAVNAYKTAWDAASKA